MNAFELLAKPIRRLLEERGFTEPTLPQAEAIPRILEGKNVLLIAPTGTGKTEAAFLPILHQLLVSGRREPGIKLVYITPLRALNRDMLERLEWWCRALDLRIVVRHGDTAARERRVHALSPPDVVVTTPETLQVFLLGRRLSRYLRSLRWVIVDEVHELADNKRGAQLALTLERLRKVAGRDFQVVGLSATIGSPQEVARFLVGTRRPCEVVDVTVHRRMEFSVVYPEAEERDKVLAQQLYTFPDVVARLRVMRELMESHRSTLVFTNTRPMAEILGSRFKLWDLRFPVEVHHGSLASHTRVRAERGLKRGELRGIICTSSMELGLDIGLVDLVIQYNSPRQVTRLVQRVGRSGHRIGRTARGVIIVQDPDDAVEALVLVRLAKRGELEPTPIPEKPLDVLLHALAAELVARPEGQIDEVTELFRQAHPFRELERDEVLSVVRFGESLERKLMRVVEGKKFGRAGRNQRLFEYYFNNLSMIPEFKQYLVMDEEQNQPVGVLDESFMAEYGEPGVKFVMGGQVWRIVQVFRRKVYVRREEDPLGAIPTWIGEEIPVPFKVAQEVGKLRERFAELLAAGFDEACRRLATEFETNPEVLRRAFAPVRAHVESGLPLPTHRCMTVERVGDLCLLNACFGTLVNRTLGRLLAHRFSRDYGVVVGVTTDPYRVVLRSDSVQPADVVRALCDGTRRKLRRELREMIEGSRFFRWRLAQVARRMGVLREEAELTSSTLDRLVRSLRGTPAFEEAFKETSAKDLDFERALDVLAQVRAGAIKVVSLGTRRRPSPISEEYWKRPYHTLEPVAPRRLKALALASAEARLMSETVTLACLRCRRFVGERKIYELDDPPSCPVCGATDVGVASEPEDEVRKALELRERGQPTRLWRLLSETSKLVSKYGRTAALVLAGRGVTPAAAREILSRVRKPGKRLFELVLAKEREALFRRFA
jgi:ATP-dependent Lhr-like helicase